MTTIKSTSDDRTIRFTVTTTDTVTTYSGTDFVPNTGEAKISNGEIVSLMLDQVDEDGFDVDDPAGPDGAVLGASFGGGELTPEGRAKLPTVAQKALATIDTLLA